jgi:hypothetical protein
MREILWLSELRDDIESDLSVFHRIEDMETMASDRLIRLACRLPAYAGAVAARHRLRNAEREAAAVEATAVPTHPSRPMLGYRVGAPSMHWTRAAVPVA